MGYNRQPSRHVIESARIVCFIGEQEITDAFRAADPFGVADRCELGPRGEHYAIGSCGDVVCAYCARIFWS
jgi:hypothetical protein